MVLLETTENNHGAHNAVVHNGAAVTLLSFKEHMFYGALTVERFLSPLNFSKINNRFMCGLTHSDGANTFSRKLLFHIYHMSLQKKSFCILLNV